MVFMKSSRHTSVRFVMLHSAGSMHSKGTSQLCMKSKTPNPTSVMHAKLALEALKISVFILTVFMRKSRRSNVKSAKKLLGKKANLIPMSDLFTRI